jgi:hypothetical protein
MNDKPKSVWTRPWQGRRKVLAWFALLAVTIFMILLGLGLASAQNHNPAEHILPAIGLALGISLLVVVAVWFIRWLCCWRNVKKVLFGLVCLITLIALFYAVENFRGKRAWDRCKAELKAQGEKLSLDDFVPPSVPDDQNFAMQPIWADQILAHMPREDKGKKWYPARFAAVGYSNRPGVLNIKIEMEGKDWMSNTNKIGNWQTGQRINLESWQTYYRWASGISNDFPVPPMPGDPAADVLLALSRHTNALEELRAASHLPHARFPLGYDEEDKAAILLPHLAVQKSISQLLRLRCVAELAANQPANALDDIKLMSRLNDAIVIEPILISHLVAIAIFDIQMQPVWEGVVDRRWNDAQLAALDADLAQRDFLTEYQFAIRGERAFACDIVDYVKRRPEQLHNLGLLLNEGPEVFFDLRRFFARQIPSGWFDQNKASIARIYTEHTLRMVDLKERRFDAIAAKAAKQTLDAEVSNSSPYKLFSRMLLLEIEKPSMRFVRAQASLDLARTGIALERHRLAHGEFPASLYALVPQFIAKLPHDVINGQPLKYRRTETGGFILYSVGWNEKDDGGIVVMTSSKTPSVDMTKGDWVWASEAK